MSHSRVARIFALLAALSLLAAACGDSDDDGDASADTSAPVSTAATETTASETSETTAGEAGGERGGTLIWGLGSNGANFFDPHMATNPFGRSWMYPFYDRLTQIDQRGRGATHARHLMGVLRGRLLADVRAP